MHLVCLTAICGLGNWETGTPTYCADHSAVITSFTIDTPGLWNQVIFWVLFKLITKLPWTVMTMYQSRILFKTWCKGSHSHYQMTASHNISKAYLDIVSGHFRVLWIPSRSNYRSLCKIAKYRWKCAIGTYTFNICFVIEAHLVSQIL